jgi:hypothetical protein
MPSAPAAAVEMTPELQAEISKFVPTYNALTPGNQAEARKLVTAIMKHQAAGEPIPQEIAVALGNVVMS